MRILVGFVWDGKSGGIDVYLMAFARVAAEEGVHLDFLTNEYCEELAIELEGMGHRLFEIATLRNRTSQRKTIQTLCESNRYEAAYFNVSTALTYPLVHDAVQAGIPKIAVHSHASDVDEPFWFRRFALRLANKVLRRKMRKCATHRFACSQSAASWLFGSSDKCAGGVAIIQNPVDVDRCDFNPQTRATVRESMGLGDSFVIGSVTAMKDVKNPWLLIDSFGEFEKNHPDAHLLVVGGGELHEEISDLASRKLREGTYSFLGKRSDVGELLQAFDVFLLTSKKEGLSIAAIEAQTSGLPCVLSSGVPSEAVISADLVTILSVDDPVSQWANAISDIYKERKGGVSRRSWRQEVVRAGYSPEAPKKALELMTGSALDV